jgi:hypothetical protein
MNAVLADSLARCVRSGVLLFLENGTDRKKLQAPGKGDPPAHLLKRVGEFREALIEALPTLVLDRERADTAVAAAISATPPDVPPDFWRKAIDGLWVFVAAGHGAEAERLGWPRDELYRVPELWSQIHLSGAALLVCDCEVTEITAGAIRVKTTSGAIWAFYRRPKIDYALAYRERIRLAGEDGRGEEVRLRALEAVVNLYLSHHPGVDIDTAKAAVLGSVKRGTAP